MAAPAQTYRAIHAIADRLEPSLRRAFLAAVTKLQGRLSLAALARAVERGEVTIEITSVLNSWPRDLQAAVRVLNEAFAAAAKLTTAQLAVPATARSIFTLVNPFAVDAAERTSARLIREITGETRRAVRRTIADAIRTGLPPPEAAKVIKPLVGLTERQAAAVMRLRLGLERDQVKPERIAKQTERYAAQLARRRAVMIARTETIRSSTEGQLAIWRQAQAVGLLDATAQKRWTVTPDDRLCEECQALDGVEVGLDESFPGRVSGPPLHPNCRCAVVMATATKRGRRAA